MNVDSSLLQQNKAAGAISSVSPARPNAEQVANRFCSSLRSVIELVIFVFPIKPG